MLIVMTFAGARLAHAAFFHATDAACAGMVP